MADKKILTRRDFLAKSGGVAAGVALASTGLGMFVPKAKANGITLHEYPWIDYLVKPLDVEAVRALWTKYYSEGNGCVEGSFRALIEELGDPFSLVPSELLFYGRGGGVAWGTLCGSVN